ncbi:MAG: Luciferase-like monooxygenase [Ilumatobacteraceae bacterium]|nr:Luciferase-like monooxygenase [Ilumatobacteraceae bacterium]
MTLPARIPTRRVVFADMRLRSHIVTSLSVLDLVPISSGSTARQALANSVHLAQRAEAAGYRRFWLAEHHLNPGVAGTTPALIIAHIAAATDHIRVGSGAVQMGHQTPLSVVEQFGLLDTLHPGRIDLGLGRSGFRRPTTDAGTGTGTGTPAAGPQVAPLARRTERGLLLPPPFSPAALLKSPRFRLQMAMLQQPNAQTPDYADQVDQVLALIAGTHRSADGTEAHVVPGEGAQLDVWILGSSGGASAEIAGHRGLPFAANYHVAPSSVLEAIQAYRLAFRPSAGLSAPHVSVSADVVVADSDQCARELATGYGAWVRSIRSGDGAIAFPTPEEARRHVWTDADRALVQDRLDTQFVGSPSTVADQLQVLAADTGADEMLITTITHDHRDRVRSYELLAAEWSARTASAHF